MPPCPPGGRIWTNMQRAQLGPPMVHMAKFHQNRLKTWALGGWTTDRHTHTHTHRQTNAGNNNGNPSDRANKQKGVKTVTSDLRWRRLTKGHNSKKRKGRVIVLAHCTTSEHALSAYKVSTKSIHWFWSYAPDKKCGRKDGRTERQRSANL